MILSTLLLIYYKIFKSQREGEGATDLRLAMSKGVKILLFLNSLIINDLSLRKYEDKFSLPSAFFLLLGQKFLSIMIIKLLVQGKFPSFHDQSFVILLGLHFLTFIYFHSSMGKELMNRVRESR